MANARAAGFSGISGRLGLRGHRQSFVTIGIEGAVLALIALYMLVAPDSARENIRLIAGLVFIGVGGYQIQRAYAFYQAGTHHAVVPIRFVAGGVMAFGGLLIVLEKLTGHFNLDAARIVLASTLIASGIFGLLAGLLGRRDGDLKLDNMIASAVLLVLAGFNIAEVRSGNDKTSTLGIIVLILGLALIGYAYLLRQKSLGRPATAGDAPDYSPPGDYTAPDETIVPAPSAPRREEPVIEPAEQSPA